MSIRPMTKRCGYCHRIYTYNPSTGDLGTRCKFCGKVREQPLATFKSPKVQTTTFPHFSRSPGKQI